MQQHSQLSCRNELGFLGSDSVLSTTALDGDSVVVSSSNNALNVAVCNTFDVTSNASTSSIVIV